MALLPVAVYALEVPCGGALVPALRDFPATFRITMAALDPTVPPQLGDPDLKQRATLKIFREQVDDDDEDEKDDSDDDDIAAIRARLGDALPDDGEDEEDDDEESSDDEKNGGPSDPSKSKKARKEAAVKQLMESLNGDVDMDVDVGSPKGMNGTKINKGKARASAEEEDEDDAADIEDAFEDVEMEEHVLCTLDPERLYQQPLDITVGEDERVYFQVTGTHSIHLTGNYVIPADDHDHDDEEDYESDEDEIGYGLGTIDDEDEEDEEEDELDGLEDPRITEIGTDEEEAPKLVKAGKNVKKGQNKRAADNEEASTLDDMISKTLKPTEAINGEAITKKQAKKLKNNAGQAVAPAAEDKPTKKEAPVSSPANGKKVQFAKNLEQGPTPSPKVDVKSDAKKDDKPKSGLGVKMVQGVKVDDKKLGSGPAAKKGDRIGMRYIGKLEKDGRVFDSNKKGKPFTFKLGAGEVIKGWDIGVTGMAVGGERRIHIPAHLGYGSKGVPGIPPNSNLVFDIKMISLN